MLELIPLDVVIEIFGGKTQENRKKNNKK